MNESKWLLLIHNVPPKPAYFRVKVWRHLQKLGSVALKNSVYVLPRSDQHFESFQWLMREINQGGGEATICEANFVEGISDTQVEGLFSKARDAEYVELVKETREVSKKLGRKKVLNDDRHEIQTAVLKLKKRLSEITAVDFFGASTREATEGLFNALSSSFMAKEPGHTKIGGQHIAKKELQSRTWVTRRGIHVDRMASAWLIRRFIDPKASFKFVEAKGYVPAAKELRFDMFEAEFTHEGDLCSFEVLILRTNLKDHALNKIAEIVHDIDLKDKKYGHEETVGFDQLVKGIVSRIDSDEERLQKASDMLDNFYEIFKNKK